MVPSIRGTTTGINPDLIACTIRYHVVFSTTQRVNIFSSEHREPMADLSDKQPYPFRRLQSMLYGWHQTTCPCILMPLLIILLDEIVHAIMDDLEREMTRQFPALKHNNQPC